MRWLSTASIALLFCAACAEGGKGAGASEGAGAGAGGGAGAGAGARAGGKETERTTETQRHGGEGEGGEGENSRCPPLAIDLPELPSIGDAVAVPEIAFAGALEPFYEKLARVLRRRAHDHARIAVYGDSNGTMDFMTGEMRRLFQTKYGPDVGHGFVAVGRPWNWYRHRYVRHDSMKDAAMKDTWEPFTVTTKPTMDGYYGHALIAGESTQAGAPTWVGTAEEGAPIGTRATSFDVYFLKWRRGGAFDVKVDGKVTATVDSAQKTSEAGFFRVEVPDGPHTLALVPKTFRKVRVFGVAVEREPGDGSKGIQVDGLGVGSLNCLTMLRDDPAINRATLARRSYDLVAFHLGSNTFVAGDLGTCMHDVIARHRAALPDATFLVMSPPDFLDSFHPPRTASWLRKVVDVLRASAEANGAAFFDFRQAMGGDGAMGRFQDEGLTQGDYVHFNEKGGAAMGDRVVYALMNGFTAFVSAHPSAGCEN